MRSMKREAVPAVCSLNTVTTIGQLMVVNVLTNAFSISMTRTFSVVQSPGQVLKLTSFVRF